MKIDLLSEQQIQWIEQGQLYHFFHEMERTIGELDDSELDYALRNLRMTYDALIDFFRKGTEDPERERVYQQILSEALLLNDRCTLRTHMQKEMPYLYEHTLQARHETLRTYRIVLEESVESKRRLQQRAATEDVKDEIRELAQQHDRHIHNLFIDLWTQGPWEQATAAEAKLLLQDTVDAKDVCTLVSAVTLNLLRCFDAQKMLFLCQAYDHKDIQVSMRALVGIVMTCYSWNSRIRHHAEVKGRLQLLCEEETFAQRITEVIIQFIRCSDTEKIDRKMREEIIPGLMKNPKLRQMPNISSIDELSMDDMNPEWERWMKESGLEDNLKEITEWQMEGADVNMGTFSQLKRYPFFYQISNWFRPFDTWQADVIDCIGMPTKKNNPIAASILETGFLCNSDKYSYCMAIREIPQMQRDAIMAQLEQNNEALKAAEDVPNLKRLNKETVQSAIRQYIQDIYRFYKLFPNIKEFDNPFQYVGSSVSHPAALHKVLTTADSLYKLIELNIRRKDYTRAIYYLTEMEEWHPELMEATQWQQLGLCYQKQHDYAAAIDCYDKADLLQSNSYWTLVHLAQCYRDTAAWDKALRYYEQTEQMKPDNLNLTYHTANCLMQLKRYRDALNRLHKIDYLHPESIQSTRPLLYCYLMLGEREQADKYATRMMGEQRQEMLPVDWRYAGYNRWLQGKREEAFECWRQSESGKDESFATALVKEHDLLLTLGFKEDELPFLYDTYYRASQQ